MIYILLLVLLLIYSSVFDFKSLSNSRRRNSIYIALFIFFVLIAGLGYFMGNDTYNYVDNYKYFPKLSELTLNYFKESRYQPGWVLFESFCRTFSDSFTFLQFLQAIYIYSILFIVIKRNTSNWFYVLALFLLVNYLEFSFEIRRESMAVCTSLLAFYVYSKIIDFKRKILYSIVLLLLAFSFHASAIIGLLLIPIYCVKPTYNKTLFILFGTFVFYYFMDKLDVLPILKLLFNEDVNSRFIESYSISESRINIKGLIYLFIKFSFIPLLIICINKRQQHKFTILMLIYIAFRIYADFSVAFYRFSNYFAIFYFITLADTIKVLFNKYQFSKKGIVLVLVAITVFLSLNIKLLYPDEFVDGIMFYDRYFPYNSILEQGNTY